MSVPLDMVIDLYLQLIYAFAVANHGLPRMSGCTPTEILVVGPEST